MNGQIQYNMNCLNKMFAHHCPRLLQKEMRNDNRLCITA